MSGVTTRLLHILSLLLGGGSLLLFGCFLFSGPLGLINLGMSANGALFLDGALSLFFFIQHSGMVRKSFRRRLERFVPEEFHGEVYSIASVVALLIVIAFWQEGTLLFCAPSGPIRWSFRALFLLSLAGFLWSGMSLKSLDTLGVKPLINLVRKNASGPILFSAQGAYGLVRHPIYLFTILMIWSSPDLTSDRLLFNLLWTVWIVVGAFLEERDLVAEFGETYLEYQRRVPMFIPGSIGVKGKRNRN